MFDSDRRRLDCPRSDQFSTRLPDLAQVNPRSRRRRHSELLGEFAFCSNGGLFALVVFPFGDGPRVLVPVGPQRPSGMHEEEFKRLATHDPEGKEPGTTPWHRLLPVSISPHLGTSTEVSQSYGLGIGSPPLVGLPVLRDVRARPG